jgi:hypothetical protein
VQLRFIIQQQQLSVPLHRMVKAEEQASGRQRHSTHFLNSADTIGHLRELAKRHGEMQAVAGGDLVSQLQYSLPRLQREHRRSSGDGSRVRLGALLRQRACRALQ